MSEINYKKIIELLSKKLDNISDSILLSSLMGYRKEKESKINEIIATKAKKAVWDQCDGTKNVKEITDILGLKSHSTVSDHLKVMIEERIIFRKQIGNETYPISIDSLIERIILQNI